MEKKKKYIIYSIYFIIISFLAAIFVFSKSYAFEGFGKINLSCEQGNTGENIECKLIGVVSENNSVSSLSSQIELSENLELGSFIVGSEWSGDVRPEDNGNIQLYGLNKTGEFEIGTFTVKVKEGTFNTTETIKLTESIFYDDKFVDAHKIEDTSVNINTPHFSSEKYDLTKDYIITDTKDISAIIKEINSDGCSVVVYNNDNFVTSGDIVENSKLQIVTSNSKTVIKEFALVYINSEKYDLSNNFVMVSTNNLLNIINDIEVLNGSVNIKNNQLVLSYNHTSIRSYDILNVYSDIYKVDLKDGYILINEENKDNIKENIINSDNISLLINDNKIDINYNEKIVKSLAIMYIYSNKYTIDFNKGFIYTYDDVNENNIKSNISANANLLFDDNKLKFNYNDINLINFDILNISSDKYYIDNANSYIYTINDNDLNKIKSNIKLVNGELVMSNNKLLLKYNESIVREFDLYNITSAEYKIEDKTIYISELVTYNDFVNNILINGLTYKIFDTSNNEVNSGNINNNFILKLYKGDKEIDSYVTNLEYLEFSNLNVDEDDKIIYNLVLDTTYNDVIKNINTNGKIVIKDRDGQIVDLNSKVRTYDVITIEFGSKTLEYKISVFGDLSGTGDVNVGDVAKLYQGIKGKITLDKLSVLAGDVARDGEIAVNDVAKLYQYLKGRIASLD